MKTKGLLWTSGVFLCVLVHTAAAAPFDESKGWIFHEMTQPIRKEFKLPEVEMPVSDYILALSKATGINFIVDATLIPPDAQMQPFPASAPARAGNWKPTFNVVMNDLSAASALSRLRYDETTFLLWPKPEALRTAQLVVAAGKHRPTEALPNQGELHRALDDYAKRSLGWNEDATAPPKFQGKIGDLPPELRAQITALAHYFILRPDLRRELFFSDDYWKTARIRVGPTRQPGIPLGIFISGQDENGKRLPFFRSWSDLLFFADENLEWSPYPRRGMSRQAPGEVAPTGPVAVQTPPVQVTPTQGIPAASLETDPLLQTKVSVEAARRPLSDLLGDLSQKSPVKLVLGEGLTAPVPLVSLRVSEMPLGTAMGALGRLYGAYWTKQNDAEYRLQSYKNDALQTALLRSGKGEFVTASATWETDQERQTQNEQLEKRVVAGLAGKGADRPEGIAFDALPADVQQEIRQVFEQIGAEIILKNNQKAWQFVSDESLLRLRRPTSPLAYWEVQLLMPDDRNTLMLTKVFPDAPTGPGRGFTGLGETMAVEDVQTQAR